MERARFFATLHWGRALKRAGYNVTECYSRLVSYYYGYADGWNNIY